ncbi:hypothetical protein PHG25p200nc [Aeromonas phage 25]|uniref:Uncharacterized protein n=1 Tax=Aeromonas phage 25 TaxID=2911441 RepID=Q19CG7_9CAUD|nr:hypothetical protein PHG25p200nc [Aeromonas phage 25]ABF72758.1 hypothetical protein PHG25p200nc [Aeromonas phage 25]
MKIIATAIENSMSNTLGLKCPFSLEEMKADIKSINQIHHGGPV